MKGLGIMLMAGLLAIAPGYGSAQQSTDKGQFPTGKPAEEGQFQTEQPAEEGTFPTGEPAQEGNFPTEQPGKKVKSPMEETTQPKGQKGTGEQAQPVKNYSPNEKKAYLKKTGADLAAMQKRIDSLKVKKEYKMLQRKRMNMGIEVDLRKKALNARKQFAVLEKAPDMAWGGLKTEMDKSMLDLQKAYSDALQFFSPEGK